MRALSRTIAPLPEHDRCCRLLPSPQQEHGRSLGGPNWLAGTMQGIGPRIRKRLFSQYPPMIRRRLAPLPPAWAAPRRAPATSAAPAPCPATSTVPLPQMVRLADNPVTDLTR